MKLDIGDYVIVTRGIYVGLEGRITDLSNPLDGGSDFVTIEMAGPHGFNAFEVSADRVQKLKES